MRHVDHDGDGRTDVFETVGERNAVVRRVEAPRPGADPPRTVVLAIDGIPYETFRAAQAAGRFRAFFPAGRMIAPFPSLTGISFADILRTVPPAAYEDKFFDPARNVVGGGIAERVTGEYRSLAPYHDVFDFEAPRFWGGFVFLAPERVALAELERVRERLAESDEPELVLYMGTTDGLGHEEGRAAMAEHLARIDRVLERWLADGGGRRRVVLVSDHGMTDRASRRVDLEDGLARAGFRLGDRIEGPDDVVAPAYGLVGSIQLYAACGRERDLARALVEVGGVDFAAWQDGERWGAVDAAGRPDPLARSDSVYPDLARRVEEGLASTLHPASVIASLEDGWHYGLGLFEPFVSLAGTHGSARAASSVGFLASNVDPIPAEVDARDVYPYLGLAREPEPDVDVPYRCVDVAAG